MIFAKHSMIDAWQGSEYALGSEYASGSQDAKVL